MAGHAWRADHVGLDWKGFRFAPSEVVPRCEVRTAESAGDGKAGFNKIASAAVLRTDSGGQGGQSSKAAGRS